MDPAPALFPHRPLAGQQLERHTMKKLATLAALAALALPVIAATEVTSSNVVGYTKVNLDAGYNMIGVQFVNIGGAAKDLATVATLDASMAGFDENGDYDTQMKLWRNGNYETYGWSGTSGTDVLDDSTLDNKWLNLDLEETDDSLPKADAFWVKAGSAGFITILGEVPTGSVTVPLAAGYNMVANPFPKDVSVTSFGTLLASMEGFDENGDYATQMKVWKDGNYVTYGWSGSSGTDVLDDSTLDNKWLNLDLEETDDVVAAGHGVWIKAGSAGSITFNAD